MTQLERVAGSAILACLLAGVATAQTEPAPTNHAPAAAKTPPAAAVDTPAEPPNTRHGEVLFQSHGEPPSVQETNPPGPVLPAAEPNPPKPAGNALKQPAQGDPVPDLSDRERTSFQVIHYDLDARLQPSRSGIEVRASLTVRNHGTEPLQHVPLQISSTLRWEAASEVAADGTLHPVSMVQHTIDTDADHTGRANEAIVTLAEPLAPGALVRLDTLYTGTLPRSTARLRRIGVAADQAATVDWDGIGGNDDGQTIALRGFGNVLWYPVVSPQLFLGEGNELFRAVGAMRQHGREIDARLQIRVEYNRKPPTALFFCGRREELRPVNDAGGLPAATGAGVATAEWPVARLGFRTMSLFGVDQPEQRIAPLPSESTPITKQPQFSSSAATVAPERADPAAMGAARSGDSQPMLAVATVDDGALPVLAASAEHVAPLLMEWFGARPLSPLTVFDATGQPFQEGALLRAPISTLGASSSAGVLAHSMTAAWVQTGEPWMDEGLGQFVELLWTEQSEGRPTALAQMGELMSAVALAEPALDRARLPKPAPAEGGSSSQADASARSGEALVDAESELFYRRKAAAVWWMLRDIAGEAALRQALNAWQTQSQALQKQSPREVAIAFQRVLERTSGKDLAWFFDDWVLRDRGLPDLTISDVTPRQLPAGQGHDSGWLVAVTARNDGAAAAEVPLVVRSGSFSSSRRLRVPGFGTATERILVESPPTEVVLNDGSTPEVRTSIHSRSIVSVPR